MRIAIVGCGFVADYYVRTLAAHPELELVGVTDRDPERVDRFVRYYSSPRYESLDDLLRVERSVVLLVVLLFLYSFVLWCCWLLCTWGDVVDFLIFLLFQ